jgi:hypothetical protein
MATATHFAAGKAHQGRRCVHPWRRGAGTADDDLRRVVLLSYEGEPRLLFSSLLPQALPIVQLIN